MYKNYAVTNFFNTHARILAHTPCARAHTYAHTLNAQKFLY